MDEQQITKPSKRDFTGLFLEMLMVLIGVLLAIVSWQISKQFMLQQKVWSETVIPLYEEFIDAYIEGEKVTD